MPVFYQFNNLGFNIRNVKAWVPRDAGFSRTLLPVYDPYHYSGLIPHGRASGIIVQDAVLPFKEYMQLFIRDWQGKQGTEFKPRVAITQRFPGSKESFSVVEYSRPVVEQPILMYLDRNSYEHMDKPLAIGSIWAASIKELHNLIPDYLLNIFQGLCNTAYHRE